ncbi:hypothetical protein FRC01_003251 [Tulasnella sp. 417]|nr:hypothetical protein FRC01_003251 [Tulasnella sp. 417]
MSIPLCEDCIKGYRLPGEPSGEMATIGAFKTYFRKSASSTNSEPSKKAVVLFTDAFGLTIPNTQLIGDSLGQSLDVDVYVPDIFEGKPPLSHPDLAPFTADQPGITLSLKQKLGWTWVMLKNLPGIAMHRPDVVKKRAEAFIKALKEAKHYDRIGAVGYCLGGEVYFRCCAAIHIATTGLVDAVVIAHPGPTSRQEVGRIRTPTSWVCAEEDVWLSVANREQYHAILSAKSETQAFESHVYPGSFSTVRLEEANELKRGTARYNAWVFREPSGEMVPIGSFQSYFRKSSSGTESEPSKKAIVLFTDAFGLTIPNTQLIGDSLGQSLDVDIYVPDLFEGKPPLRHEDLAPFTADQPGVTLSLKQKLGWLWTALKSFPGTIANRPDVVRKRGEAFVKALKEAKHDDRIGVVGYCLGGCAAIHIATTALADTVVIAHPGPTSREEVGRIRTPTSWACAEEDMWLSVANRDQYEAILRAKSETQAFEIHVYPGTTHGFSVRPNLDIPQLKQAYEGALQQTTKWFQETL